MDEILKIFLGTAGALVVFVVSQAILKLFIEPVVDLRKTIGEIQSKRMLYGNLTANPAQSHEPMSELERAARLEAARALREGASSLTGKARGILGYDAAAKFGIIPSRTKLDNGAKALIGLSNSAVYGNPDHVARYEEELAVALDFAPESGRGAIRTALRKASDEKPT